MSEVLSLAGAERDVSLGRATGALRAGQLVVVPTDTVYGVAADAFNKSATRRIFEIKKRPRSLPLPILVSRPRQAWALSAHAPPEAAELVAAFWPGALTLVLPETELDWDLGDGGGGIAMRMPDHPDALGLLEMVGPLAVTSANVTGEPTRQTIAGVRERLGDDVALYLDAGPSARETGSTIVDLTRAKPTVVREGPISIAEVEKVIGEVERA